MKLVGRFHLFLGWKEYLYGDGNGSVYKKKKDETGAKGKNNQCEIHENVKRRLNMGDWL